MRRWCSGDVATVRSRRGVGANAQGGGLGRHDLNIFESPPTTLNPPAIVVSRPIEVRYGVAGFGVDAIELPVVCMGPMEGDDLVDG